jgi:predicted TPR repeat methyltransferase
MRLLLLATILGALLLGGARAQGETRAERLDALFERLSEGDAQAQSEIEALWYAPPEAGIGVLFGRAVDAMNEGDADLALVLLSHVTGLAPSYAEGWVLTGHARSAAGDAADAARAYQQALEIEPRHFVAIARLGDLAVEAGDKGAALERYREALLLNPSMRAVRERADRLRDETRAQEI